MQASADSTSKVEDSTLQQLWEGKTISKTDASQILNNAADLFSKEPNIIELSGPICVVGDIRGHLVYLLEVFKQAGKPPKTKYLFLGNLVNGGKDSIEVFLLVAALKVLHPEEIHLLRGNHEQSAMSLTFGLSDEIKEKYGDDSLFNDFVKTFNQLSMGAILNEKIFFTHGGLSKEIQTLSDIKSLKKGEVPDRGPFADLLWSDPSDIMEDYGPNQSQNGSAFSAKPVEKFLDDSKTALFVRSNQCVDEGHKYMFGATLLTIWSVPNFEGKGNKGTVLIVNQEKSLEYREIPASEQK